MAFDSQTRNKLQRMVGACRRLLADEFDDQLQGLYGIYAQDGRVLELDKLTSLDDDHHQTATLLRDRIEHLRSGMPAEKQPLAEAVRRVLREQAFTLLNRFAALRMAEERGFVQECVGQGLKSKGFQVFETVARSGLGGAYERYVTFIHGMFDELSLDLGVLFDRWSPFGLLFPREPALLKFFDLLNDPELKPLWKEDETVGWIYQYFNDEAERKKMREESSAPRNSRELAVRNQFFTPRYVVEFLTDNTLGRIWYEMTQGATTLKEQCRYLVRRPNEIFLQPGESAPEQPKQDNLSQEDLLKQPVFIPHRPLKDPRTILMLDPACGSMHFGLYAFDLFEVIYDEAWALEEKLGADALSRPPGMKFLHATYAGKDAFLKDVPRLIIEHNLHGIDIDPRCAQIAGLSLWLRAQKAWQRLGLKPAERPAIKRSNIVCAEPMPGEKELLREFVEREFPAAERAVCLRLLEAIFDKMQLAGEAGSLLKIEEEIRSAIEDARGAWQKLATKPPELFTTTELNQLSTDPELTGLEQAVSSLTTDPRHLTTDFWERIEERIYAALRDYAEQAENGGGFQRRLFAEDAARGFAFIDVCRKRYDVALMNPPFGRRSEPSSEYFDRNYGPFKSDMGLAFVDSFSNRLVQGGQLGALTSRTFLAGGSFAEWRHDVLLSARPVRVLLDLGIGVLDDALVETCAYVVQHQSAEQGWFLRGLEAKDKGESVDAFFSDPKRSSGMRVFSTLLASMRDLPTSIMAYWLPPDVAATIKKTGTLESIHAATKHGVQTTDDFQFMRLAWEVCSGSVSQNGRWPVLAKGGEYAPYFDNLHLCVDWLGNGARLKEYLAAKRMETQGSPDWTPWMNSHEDYFKPGLTFPARTASDFCPRILPAGCVFTASGQALLFPNNEQALGYLGGAFTRSFKIVVDAFVCSGDNSVSGSAANTYRTGLVNALPLPTDVGGKIAQEIGSKSVCLAYRLAAADETSLNFSPSVHRESSMKAFGGNAIRSEFEVALELLELSACADREAQAFFGFSDELLAHLHGPLPTAYPSDKIAVDRRVLLMSEEKLVAEALSRYGPRRQLTKKTYIANRRLELLCHILQLHPSTVIKELESQQLWHELHPSVAEDEASLLLGIAFGRWDIRYATGELAAPKLPDPFAPLPVCPPGQLQNAQDLPARPEDVPAAYPVRIPWDGILVDDPNHPLDIERRVREVIEIIWSGKEGGPTAEAIEHEACEILGVKSLRDYFRKPAGFFADHLKRYSKSRRQAPIYWPLATASGSYTLWIYYHRLTDQTLFQCVNDFVKPKLEEVNRDIERLRGELQRADGGSSKQREKLEELEDFIIELKEFHDELLRVAGLPYKPNLNDGVIITASPLWKLFRLPKWQKELKACWAALEGEEYEWAHLAYTIWPDRVKQVCKTDRSIAIAHGLEELCDVKAPEKKAKRGKKKAEAELEMD